MSVPSALEALAAREAAVREAAIVLLRAEVQGDVPMAEVRAAAECLTRNASAAFVRRYGTWVFSLAGELVFPGRDYATALDFIADGQV